jgi:preprotein translocase subunit SecA
MGLFDGLKREVSSRGDPLVSLAMEGKQMLAAYGERVTRINGLEAGVETLTDSELRGKTSAFRARIRAGDSPNDVLEDAFACVREASYRVLGLRHFDVQVRVRITVLQVSNAVP